MPLTSARSPAAVKSGKKAASSNFSSRPPPIEDGLKYPLGSVIADAPMKAWTIAGAALGRKARQAAKPAPATSAAAHKPRISPAILARNGLLRGGESNRRQISATALKRSTAFGEGHSPQQLGIKLLNSETRKCPFTRSMAVARSSRRAAATGSRLTPMRL